MNSLNDATNSLKLEPPSLWFWMKAGLGMALGFFLLFMPVWFFLVLGGLGIVGAALGGRPHGH